MTWKDQLKYSNFLDDLDLYISCTRVVNFNMIYNDVGRYSEQSKPTKIYQTVKNSNMKKLLKSEKNEAVAGCLRFDKPDISVEKFLC